jgi:beta-lactamase superfamily II metal-dependent hydrolase
MISIEMFPAGNGDSILVCFDQHIILIDGGYTSTYRDHLKPRLKELDAQGLRLSKFIVTHIDSDHITGAIDFIEDNGPQTILPLSGSMKSGTTVIAISNLKIKNLETLMDNFRILN